MGEKKGLGQVVCVVEAHSGRKENLLTDVVDRVRRQTILMLSYERKPWIKVWIRIKILGAKSRDSNKTRRQEQ